MPHTKLQLMLRGAETLYDNVALIAVDANGYYFKFLTLPLICNVTGITLEDALKITSFKKLLKHPLDNIAFHRKQPIINEKLQTVFFPRYAVSYKQINYKLAQKHENGLHRFQLTDKPTHRSFLLVRLYAFLPKSLSLLFDVGFVYSLTEIMTVCYNYDSTLKNVGVYRMPVT